MELSVVPFSLFQQEKLNNKIEARAIAQQKNIFVQAIVVGSISKYGAEEEKNFNLSVHAIDCCHANHEVFYEA